MDEPVADMVRGVLDGHVILDRNIAERGRFPAIDVLRSVSRSFTKAHNAEAQEIIAAARTQMSVYAQSELMIQAGLYKPGADAAIDQSIRLRPKLEGFLSGGAQPKNSTGAIDLARLAEILTDTKTK
jgi:flagellum-specific ATP synthase